MKFSIFFLFYVTLLSVISVNMDPNLKMIIYTYHACI